MIGNYNQLTIKQFLQCKTIAELEPDPVNRKVKMLSAVTGQDIDVIESLPIGELFAKLKEFSEVETLQTNQKVRMNFKVAGKRFECIWKLQELSAAQYIDVSHFTKEQDNIVQNIHNILAAVCVKSSLFKRKKYNGDDHKEVAELFYNNMKISQAYPLMLFFCKFFEVLERNIATCLMGEIQKTEQMIRTSIRNGDGLQR